MSADLQRARGSAERRGRGGSPVFWENTCTCDGSILSRTVEPRCGGVRAEIRAVICWAVISSSSGMPARVP